MSLGDDVYERLKRDIFEFRMTPGERISETEISARYAVSRTPVREALGRLRQEGFVALEGRRGWSVTPFDFDAFDELYEVRVTLEHHAARRLAAGGSDDTLRDLLSRWGVAPEARLTDAGAAANLDEAFHNTLIDALGNRQLSRIYRDVTARIRIVRRLDFTEPTRVDATYDEHTGILERLRAGDADGACAALEAHIEASRDEARRITLHRLHLARQANRGSEPELPIGRRG